MVSAPLELGVRSDVTLSMPSLAVPWLLAASTEEVEAMLFLDDIGTMLSIAGASFAGVVACSGLLLLLA
jgi:nitrate/nitrite transporter NarK